MKQISQLCEKVIYILIKTYFYFYRPKLEVIKMKEHTPEQIKRKLMNVLRVFRTPENSKIIDSMIDEILEKIGHNIIAQATIKELRDSFRFQNFTDWNNVLKLDYNKKYF